MFMVVKAATPKPMNTANEIRTSGRRARHAAISLRSMRGSRSLAPLIVEEDRAARDHMLARLETLANLDPPVALDTEADLAALELHRRRLDEDDGEIPLADDRFDRHRGRRSAPSCGASRSRRSRPRK